MTAFFAPEKYSPVRYHTMELGPFIAKTKVRPGETGFQAMERAYTLCEKWARASWKQKLKEFIERVEEAGQKADDHDLPR